MTGLEINSGGLQWTSLRRIRTNQCLVRMRRRLQWAVKPGVPSVKVQLRRYENQTLESFVATARICHFQPLRTAIVKLASFSTLSAKRS